MRTRWKLLGLAGAAGVAATGAAVAKNRRPQGEYEPDEIREKLRSRMADASANGTVAGATTAPATPAPE